MMKMRYRVSRGIMVLEKPELVIESRPEDHFLKAHCSVCPRVRFNLLGNTLDEKKLLRQMFDIHFRAVHARGCQPIQGCCEMTIGKRKMSQLIKGRDRETGKSSQTIGVFAKPLQTATSF